MYHLFKSFSIAATWGTWHCTFMFQMTFRLPGSSLNKVQDLQNCLSIQQLTPTIGPQKLSLLSVHFLPLISSKTNDAHFTFIPSTQQKRETIPYSLSLLQDSLFCIYSLLSFTTCAKHLDIKFEEPNPKKWSHPLREDVFASALMGKEHYRPGSLFSPLLFGKFFDPADAFPLWEFEPDSLLPAAPRSADWHQTDAEHVLRAEIPGLQNVDVCIENGKILEISGQYQREASRTKDWKCGKWWEHGCVRRLELPDQIDWRRAEARIDNETTSLEVRIPKQTASGSADT